MIKRILMPLLLVGTLFSTFTQAETPYDARAEFMPMEQVPERVQEAARNAKAGTYLQKAKLSWETDEGVYTVMASYYGQIWRIRVTSSGKVLSVARDS